MNIYCQGLVLLICFNPLIDHTFGANPTKGFTPLLLREENFDIERPYDAQITDRHSYKDEIRCLWVYRRDKSNTLIGMPHTEARITGYDYYEGVHQFEGHVLVPKVTTGVKIMRIGGGSDFELRVYNGQLKYRSKVVISKRIYSKWFRLNVIHNVGEHIQVFIDGEFKFKVNDMKTVEDGGFYFKFGVYPADFASSYMETRWKGVRLFEKSEENELIG